VLLAQIQTFDEREDNMPQQYQINISIDSAGVQAINAAGQFVTFVKSITSSPAESGNLPVAWLSFSPFMSNSVKWQESYYLYATTTVITSGATIQETSQTPAPAQEGPIYTFKQGVFTAGTEGSATTYNMLNSQGSGLTFGLAQVASVNGTNVTAPLNAVSVLNGENASFTPIETISVFLSSFNNNGTVISQVASTALVVQLTSQEPVANVTFNDANSQFILTSQTASFASMTDVALGRLDTTVRRSRQLR
jgi:hypothetical protein